jgi:hypothetical protein
MGILRRTEALNGPHIGPVQARCPGQTGPHRFAVDDDRTGAALTFAVARLLGACQMEIMAQEIQEPAIPIHNKSMRFTVDPERYALHIVSPFLMA